MSSLLERAVGLFIEPAPGDAPAADRRPASDRRPDSPAARYRPPSPAAGPSPARDRAAVLGSAADALPIAAALARALRRGAGAPAAVVVSWAGRARARGAPAAPAARRLAAWLAARDLPATAGGRLAWASLPADADEAARVANRVAGAIDVPLVLALAGPRPQAFAALLADHALIAVAVSDPEGPLASAALAGLPGRAVACRPLAPGLARRLALLGLAAPRRLALLGLAEPRRVAVPVGVTAR
jgi:hypothetical protein